MQLNPNIISKTILDKLKVRRMTQLDLATKIDISRSGLRKMIENPSSFKLETLNKIFEELEISIEEIDNSTKDKSNIISFNSTQLKQFEQYLTQQNKDLLQVYLNYTDSNISGFELASFSFNEIKDLCKYFNIPLELLFDEKNKVHYKGILFSDFIKHKNLISSQQQRINYEIAINEIKIKILQFVNKEFKSTNNQLGNDFDYQELLEKNGEFSNFPISIIVENCNTPIVLISNSPNHYLPVQHFIEDIASRVFNKFFIKRNIKISDIFWVESSYFSNESINVSIVKFNSDSEFIDPSWCVIRNINDSQLIIDTKQVKEFLNKE
nr:helix-turn-helix domain-containing protein [uncultured Carboxylicivirga sp.]